VADWIDPFLTAADRARRAPWCKVGVVTAFSGGVITATIDGASVTDIHRVAIAYPTPTNGDVALFAVIRGTSAVQYVAVGVIT